mgnify:FL=1
MARVKKLQSKSQQLENRVLVAGVTLCFAGIVVTCWSALTTSAVVPWGIF